MTSQENYNQQVKTTINNIVKIERQFTFAMATLMVIAVMLVSVVF